MSVTYHEIDTISDSRGFVFEPVGLDELLRQKNVHVVMTQPGVIRANHFHKEGRETIVVIGPALVRFRENDVVTDVDVPENRVYRFVFPPNVPHAIKNTGHGPNVLVAFNTVEHDRDNPDTVQEILIDE